MFDTSRSILTQINSKELEKRNTTLYIKRDELIHELVSGNKWRKLKYNIELCLSKKKSGLLTFGGAFSNHLLACAAACNDLGLKSIGIVRGEELSEDSNPTLKECTRLGMHLLFISRSSYLLKNTEEYKQELASRYPNYQMVPEGGANYYGVIGCQDIVREISVEFDHIFVAQGTTTTSCGIKLALSENQKIHVVPVLKGFDSYNEMMQIYQSSGFDTAFIREQLKNVIIHNGYHFGGYGKITKELIDFIKHFYNEHLIKLDPIYTGKAMFGLMEQISKGVFDNSTVVFCHTGGIQGSRGIQEKLNANLYEIVKKT